MKLRFAFLVSVVATTLAIPIIACVSCTSAQVDQAVDAGNRVVAATKDPLVSSIGELPTIGPYVKLGANIIADIAYEFIRIIRIFDRNVEQGPATQSSSQLEDRAAPAPLPVRAVVARR